MADQVTVRRCIGSERFGIEPHDAPVDDFPKQPSQKDGLGRMCKTHWNEYTAGLARDAKARKAAVATTAPEPDDTNPPEADAAATVEPERSRKRKSTQAPPPVVDTPATEAQAEAG
jgi:hypothetical protein